MNAEPHDDDYTELVEQLFTEHGPRLVEDLKLALRAVHRPDLVPEIDPLGPSIVLPKTDLSILLAVHAGSDGKPIKPVTFDWVLYRTVVVPGVRYYPDGSGEPDISDDVEIAEVNLTATREIAKTAVLTYLEDNIDVQFEMADEDAQMKRLIEEEEIARNYFDSKGRQTT